MPRPHDPAYSRDEELKPGRPPRSAYEPEGAEGSAKSPKTRTDPVTGEPDTATPAPGQSETDRSEGAGGS